MRNEGWHARQDRSRSRTDRVVDLRTTCEADGDRRQMSCSSDAHVRDQYQIAIREVVVWLDKRIMATLPWPVIIARGSCKTARRAVTTGFSDPLFFEIVHVEPMIHDPITRNISLDVIFHEFLELVGKIAQAQVAFLVVPGNDLGTRTF